MSGMDLYRKGLYWIAMNDEPTITDQAVIAEQISTVLLADLLEKEPADVACDIARIRERLAREKGGKR